MKKAFAASEQDNTVKPQAVSSIRKKSAVCFEFIDGLGVAGAIAGENGRH
jgi:hypothetical protein